mgnify:CR=1 FL=1
MNSDIVKVATIGRCVGLKGYLKLHNKSDFPEQFKKGATFFICNEVDGLHKGDEKWPKRISGMKIYTGEQLSALLASAGFTGIQTDSLFAKRYLCVTARKG